MNQLRMHKLKNTYVGLRHGQSKANAAGLIISDPKVGVENYGLTDLGREQVTASVKKAKQEGLLDEQAIIYASDFKRASETAAIAREILGVKEVHPTPALRERYFGVFDNKHHSNYMNVWSKDLSRDTNPEDVETVEHMLERTIELLNQLEEKYSGKTILLVAHADTLQILQTAFEDMEPHEHRLLEPMQTAEVRPLN